MNIDFKLFFVVISSPWVYIIYKYIYIYHRKNIYQWGDVERFFGVLCMAQPWEL